MKFKEFYKDFVRDISDESLNPRGAENIEERLASAWIVYQTIQTNKKLVIATWVLAISSIILSLISLLIR